MKNKKPETVETVHTHTHTHTDSLKKREKSRRIKSIDIAKAIGIFLIVFGHVIKIGQLRKFIYAFHVPLFFILSGICYSIKDNKKFILGKLKAIYIPYVIISLISIVIYFFLGRYIQNNINNSIIANVLGMVYANPNLNNMQWNQPLWFLPCLMIQLILINSIENIIKNNKNRQKIRLVIIIIGTLLGHILSKFKIYLPLQLEAAMCMCIFSYMGIFIKENKEKISKLIKTSINKNYYTIIFIIVTLIIAYILNNYNTTISIMQDKYGNYLLYFLISTIMIVNILLISYLIDKTFKKQKIISYIGQNTLWILILHKFPILFFQEICPIIKNILNRSDTLLNNALGFLLSIIVISMLMFGKKVFDKIRSKLYDRN